MIFGVRQGYLAECFGHVYGAFLLTEFREVEAGLAIRETISLPGDNARTYE